MEEFAADETKVVFILRLPEKFNVGECKIIFFKSSFIVVSGKLSVVSF